jgi:hypothetical protein
MGVVLGILIAGTGISLFLGFFNAGFKVIVPVPPRTP